MGYRDVALQEIHAGPGARRHGPLRDADERHAAQDARPVQRRGLHARGRGRGGRQGAHGRHVARRQKRLRRRDLGPRARDEVQRDARRTGADVPEFGRGRAHDVHGHLQPARAHRRGLADGGLRLGRGRRRLGAHGLGRVARLQHRGQGVLAGGLRGLGARDALLPDRAGQARLRQPAPRHRVRGEARRQGRIGRRRPGAPVGLGREPARHHLPAAQIDPGRARSTSTSSLLIYLFSRPRGCLDRFKVQRACGARSV
mmetsp:Transcript_24432/g.73319  ORF Transcript_24432/g.73319 Transcript_24432/m.73319 type:complete len:257 (+) Transcript_24432:301-1071(+)